MTRSNRFARLLSVFLLSVLFALSSPAYSQWWNPNDPTPPKFRGTPFETKVVYTRVVAEQAANAVQTAFWSDDFQKIDRMYDEFMRDDRRAEDGTWFVAQIASTLGGVALADEKLVNKSLAKWAEQSPQSKLRPVAEAVIWNSRAWNARGTGFAGATAQESMQLFREKLARAAKALKDAEPEGKESPIWYWVALIVAGGSGRPSAQFDALFEEAVARFPYYQPLYYTRMNYLLPEWGGSLDAVDKFIERSVARTADKEGKSFYVWLYLDMSMKINGDFLTETPATWPKLKQGFEDLVARHPDVWNKNLYATFACRVRDKETTARLLTELGDKAWVGAYSDGITAESCRRFALLST